MRTEGHILELVGLIYDAAGDASLWPVLLERLSKALNAPTVNFAVQEFVKKNPEDNFDLGSVGLDPGYYRAYSEYYGARNPVLIRGGREMRQGRVYRAEELCPAEELHRTEFYNDWARPQRMSHALFGIVLKTKRIVSFMNAVRYKGANPFSEEDLDLLRLLNPHLERVVQLHLRIRNFEAREKATAEVFDRLPLGVIFLDAEGRLLFANRTAELILGIKDGLSVDSAGLHAFSAAETLALRQAVHGAIDASLGRGLDHPGGALPISRPSGRRPLSVLVTPIHSLSLGLFGPTAAAAVFVSDPELEEEPVEDLLCRLYGLSRAEAAVAALLAQGRSIRETCDRLHVSLNTGKTHLKWIFEKTATRRQAELVRLIAHSPASLLWPEVERVRRELARRVS